jgi:hypothetical protein
VPARVQEVLAPIHHQKGGAMSGTDRQLVLVQAFVGAGGEKDYDFTVKKMVNTTNYHLGQRLSKAEVDQAIRLKIKCIIVEH